MFKRNNRPLTIEYYRLFNLYLYLEKNSLSDNAVVVVKESKLQDYFLTVGEQQALEISRYNMIGEGLHGTVFQGDLKGQKVAVERVQLIDLNEDHHKATMGILTELKHPNILNLICYEQDFNFRQVVNSMNLLVIF